MFWPELDAERARRALNSAIWRLRKLLASEPRSAGGRNLLTIGTETILERAPWLDIDATALQEAAAMALRQPETLLDRAKLNHVAQVLHRYEGPFLEGDDGDWILEERERLHSLFLRTATMTVCRLGAVGVYHDAISLARRALRFDPYREELVRTLLTLLALDERRGEAIQYYQQWSTSLKTELDIAPLPATRKVLEEIRGLESLEGFQTLHTLLVDARL